MSSRTNGHHRERALRVAIVDDQPDVRAILRLLLERAGVEISFESPSAEDALDRIDASTVVIVLDQNLEGALTGLESAPSFKARVPGVRIVLFSAHDLQAQAAAEPAVDAFVRKDRILGLPGVVLEVAGRSAED